MKLAILLFAVLGALPLSSQVVSPNKKFAVDYRKAGPHESDVNFIRTSDKKVLYQTFSSGAAGRMYEEIVWSPDSQYLAVASRGTKTTVSLEIYRFDGAHVTQVLIPDYRLNLLGRHHMVRGGRYRFVSQLKWDEGQLTFITKGSLFDGVSNPTDSPENWYRYQVTLDLSLGSAQLSKVVDFKQKKEEQQDAAGQSATAE